VSANPGPRTKKSPPRQCRAGQWGGILMLLGIDAVGALAALGEAGRKDTVRADPGMITRIIIPFAGYPSSYV
jgi:hypothetical protein